MKRFLLDMILLILILMVMGFHFLPALEHELVGLILMVGVIFHLIWNRRWFKGFFHGTWGKLRILQTALGILLVIVFFTAIVTGIIISNHVFRDLWNGDSIHRSVLIYQLHGVSAYLMIILGGMHIGMHWSGLWQKIKKLPLLSCLENHPKYRCWIMAAICLAGCAMSYLDQVGDRLMMKHIFGTMATRLSAWLYYPLLLCLMGLYGVVFYYLQQYFIRKKQRTAGGIGK